MRLASYCLFALLATCCLCACSNKSSSAEGSSGSGAPVADFTASPRSGNPPLMVTFTNTSTGDITSRIWDFGDGGSSSAASPVHTYETEGTYTVILTVVGPGGSDTETKTAYIICGGSPGPTVEFDATPRSGSPSLIVDFTDQSYGNNLSAWSWSFGDGGTSTVQNPQHTYNTAGTYDVTLSVMDADGTNSLTKTGYIKVTDGSSGWEEDARGLYVLGPGDGTVEDKYILNEDMVGYSIRAWWKTVNPADGVYDWSGIDAEIAKAGALEIQKGTEIYLMLRVFCGIRTPDWLFNMLPDDQIFYFVGNNPHNPHYGQTLRIPLPWNQIYQDKLKELIKQFGQRYSEHPRVKFYHLAGPCAMSCEMHLPKTAEDITNWSAKDPNYNQRILDAWKVFLDEAAVYWPKQQIVVNIANPINDWSVVEGLIDYGVSRYDKQFTIQMNALHADTVESYDAYLLVQEGYDTQINGFQMLCYGRQTERFGTPYVDSYKKALNAGADYVEIYKGDIDDFPNDVTWGNTEIRKLPWNQLPDPLYKF